MKIRKDFVTNSSSSSYIILSDKDRNAANEELGGFINYLEDFSIDSIIEYDDFEFKNSLYNADLTEKEFKKIGNFNDKQIGLIKLLMSYKLDSYLKAEKEIKDNPLLKAYYIFIDRDYLHNTPLENFIDNSKIIDYQTDL